MRAKPDIRIAIDLTEDDWSFWIRQLGVIEDFALDGLSDSADDPELVDYCRFQLEFVRRLRRQLERHLGAKQYAELAAEDFPDRPDDELMKP